MRLKGQVAIVTGAGQGIGQAIATTLAREGAAVVINDVVPERADKVAGDDLPPKNESSCNVRLELKIKGVNHGQEGIQTGANHQQAA